MIASENFPSLKEALIPLAIAAGEAIMTIYHRDDKKVREKADKSPVTEADQAAETLILAGLSNLAPGVQIVAEELCHENGLPEGAGDEFFLVDPLDGMSRGDQNIKDLLVPREGGRGAEDSTSPVQAAAASLPRCPSLSLIDPVSDKHELR